jgi:hypothetical protein
MCGLTTIHACLSAPEGSPECRHLRDPADDHAGLRVNKWADQSALCQLADQPGKELRNEEDGGERPEDETIPRRERRAAETRDMFFQPPRAPSLCDPCMTAPRRPRPLRTAVDVLLNGRRHQPAVRVCTRCPGNRRPWFLRRRRTPREVESARSPSSCRPFHQ